MILFPNCKINLGLHILGRRNDGYHNIETVMIPVPLTDILELVPSGNGETRLTVSGGVVDCPVEENLVTKAYGAVRKRYPELPATDMYLRKVIPDGAGLGGGSADAAFAILGLNRLWNLGMDVVQMENIAAEIGADCPFFISDKPAVATGTGTDIETIASPIPAGTLLALAKPGQSVSTKQAYAGITPNPDRKNIVCMLERPISQWRYCLENDFELTVGRQIPRIMEIKNIFLDAGAFYSSMSGSGSAVYALFGADKRNEADAALALIGDDAISLLEI